MTHAEARQRRLQGVDQEPYIGWGQPNILGAPPDLDNVPVDGVCVRCVCVLTILNVCGRYSRCMWGLMRHTGQADLTES
jgi:hypothetical protein